MSPVLCTDTALKMQALAALTQLMQHDESAMNRYQRALEALLEAEKGTKQLIADVTAALDQHNAAGELMKEKEQDAGANAEAEVSDKAKGKARQDGSPGATDEDDDGLPHTLAGEEHRNKKRALQQRLRECQIVMHKVQFIKGDVYHVLGETYAKEENEAYASAEDLRRVLLKST